ncbi:uncharacterized protein LY89DRAFT_699399 [Mollisia scopiformis]|uniref:Uncharacterized protein n=1 Tax=Mollisia scopiformis TaxID=149040 RepID=A0A194WXM8_MOLSC|nr:uncharacterized protein LY89DRAFT_699399 [Mollisia scopiformis]KUJ12736.1 hypothetical protein LY89DRAFT_699399 [Mollisia scopiformis]
MAPVEIHTSPSYVPTAVVFFHLFAVGYISAIAARSIYRSYVALPPSSATRHREPLRKGHVQTFSILALVSLVFAGYYASRFASLSYRVWATERGIELPTGFFGDRGALRGGEHPGRLQIVTWLNDTPYYRDALEIVTEKARHFWWGQQVTLGLISWSTYLAIEGQRRNISNIWSFLALSQLVSLSYAQNLFFVAILLTPVPLPENVREITRTSVPGTSSRYTQLLERVVPAKPEGFVPSPYSYAVLLALNFMAVLLTPFAANTPSFMSVALLARVIPFSFLALPYVIPESWGTIHSHPHDSHASYTKLFQYISAFSAILHLKSSFLALFYNIPDSTYYRHSLLHPFKEEHRSTFDRSTTALGRVFGAIGEHPAVSAQGWDVLLSGLTLGIWAAIRGLEANDMLTSTLPFSELLLKPAQKLVEDTSIALKEDAKDAVDNVVSRTTRRRPGRPKKHEEIDSNVPRRGRSAKKALELTNGVDEDDAAYEPTESDPLEGDEETGEDWEMGALTWGLLSVGGLGVGTAAVYGAEVVGR